jgi:hypothetical protein
LKCKKQKGTLAENPGKTLVDLDPWFWRKAIRGRRANPCRAAKKTMTFTYWCRRTWPLPVRHSNEPPVWPNRQCYSHWILSVPARVAAHVQ